MVASACSPGKAPSGGPRADSGAAGADSAPPPADLVGEPPATPIPAPDFAATNLDGAARDREDLLGHPTVMWFYPAAGTAG